MLVAVRLPDTINNTTKSILVNVFVSNLMMVGNKPIGYRIGVTGDIDGSESLDHLVNFVDISLESLTDTDIRLLDGMVSKVTYVSPNSKGDCFSDIERVSKTPIVQGKSNMIVRALSTFMIRCARKGELIEDYPTCDLNMLVGLVYSMIMYRTVYRVGEMKGYSNLVDNFLKECVPTDFFMSYFNRVGVDTQLGIGLLNGDNLVLDFHYVNKEGTRLQVKSVTPNVSFTSNMSFLHTSKSIVQASYAMGTEIAEVVITYLSKQRRRSDKYMNLLRLLLGIFQSYKFFD